MKLFTFSSVLAGIYADSHTTSSKGCDNNVPDEDFTCDSIWYATLDFPVATCTFIEGEGSVGDCAGCECPLDNFLENLPPSGCSLPTFEETSLFMSGILSTVLLATDGTPQNLFCDGIGEGQYLCPICDALEDGMGRCDGPDAIGDYENDVQQKCFCEAVNPLDFSGDFSVTDCVNTLSPLLGGDRRRLLEEQEGVRSLKSKGNAGKGKAKGSKGKPKGTKGNKSKEGQLDYGRFWSDFFETVLDSEARELWRVIYLGVTQQLISTVIFE
ncbi:hypothetical protein ScalyP_jg7149 [Parmales sp. scaly parma]|nr:hypothetical protein ScalyP_jg7149 [Parmales sp. scaly parma]